MATWVLYSQIKKNSHPSVQMHIRSLKKKQKRIVDGFCFFGLVWFVCVVLCFVFSFFNMIYFHSCIEMDPLNLTLDLDVCVVLHY